MKTKDIRKLDNSAIEKKINELRDDIARVQIEKFENDDKNTMKRRNLKRQLARLLTIQNELTSDANQNLKEEKAEEN